MAILKNKENEQKILGKLIGKKSTIAFIISGAITFGENTVPAVISLFGVFFRTYYDYFKLNK